MKSTFKTSGRVIIIETETIIQPFGDRASAAMFTDRTIEQWQKFACESARLEFVRVQDVSEACARVADAPPGPLLIMLDRHYISEKALKDFVKEARVHAETPVLSLALGMNASVEYTLPLQTVSEDDGSIVHDIFYLNTRELNDTGENLESLLDRLRTQSQALLVPKREIVVDIPLPTIGEKSRNILRYPVTSTVVVSIEHWTHILWLNQLAFGIRWMERLRRKPLWGIWRALTAFSLNPEIILGRLVHCGRQAKIHPTAYVSGSLIGDGAVIGPHATVRNSYIAAGAHIQDHAVILNSVVGENTMVIENTFLVSSMSYPDATIGNYKLQVTLIGRGAYINAWAGFVDAKFIGSVKVEHHGKLVETGRAFLGSVVGHRAKVAAKVLIHPGREIPNDTVVVMRPDEVVSVVPKHIPPNTPMVRDGGTLVALGEERRVQ